MKSFVLLLSIFSTHVCAATPLGIGGHNHWRDEGKYRQKHNQSLVHHLNLHVPPTDSRWLSNIKGASDYFLKRIATEQPDELWGTVEISGYSNFSAITPGHFNATEYIPRNLRREQIFARAFDEGRLWERWGFYNSSERDPGHIDWYRPEHASKKVWKDFQDRVEKEKPERIASIPTRAPKSVGERQYAVRAFHEGILWERWMTPYIATEIHARKLEAWRWSLHAEIDVEYEKTLLEYIENKVRDTKMEIVARHRNKSRAKVECAEITRLREVLARHKNNLQKQLEKLRLAEEKLDTRKRSFERLLARDAERELA